MMAQFPSQGNIAQRSYDFRTIVWLYANIGGLLAMNMGFSYDECWSRALVVRLTSRS